MLGAQESPSRFALPFCLNVDLFRLGLLGFRQGDGQQTIFVAGVDFVSVDALLQSDRALKFAPNDSSRLRALPLRACARQR